MWKQMVFFLNLCLLRAKDAKLCLCNLGKEWPTASSVDHNGRLASFPQSQPLRRTLNVNIPMKMLSWHYRCTFYAAKVYRRGCKCKKHCFIRLNNIGAPYLHLRELHIISHCCESRLFIMLLMTIPRMSLCVKPLTTIFYFVLYQIVDMLSIHYVLFCNVKTNGFT